MIRVVHTFQYYKKIFKAGDVTLGDYLLYLKEPEEAIKKILLEFNDNIPKMNESHMKEFLKILFGVDKNSKKKNQENVLDNMHITICIMAKNINQPISELLKLSLKSFNKINEDMDAILDPSKYKEKLEGKVENKRKLNELKNIISN